MKRSVLAALLFAVASPAMAQQPSSNPPPPTTVDASRGGITISSGVNSLTIGARAQFRWTLDHREQFDADTVGSGLGIQDGPLSQFDVTRLRLSLSGGMYRPWLRYGFQFELSRASGEGGSRIKDATIEFRPTGTPFRVIVGQFKAPFGLQQLTSSGRLQFVDRAITDARYNPGRDMGVLFGGTARERTIGYEAGVFNGSGESTRQNNRSQLYVGRAFVNPLGAYSLSEGSSDAPSRPLLHLGVAGRTGKAVRARSAAGTFDDADNETAYDVEFAFKAPRFFATAEHFWATLEQENPTPGADIHSRGYHAQASYLLVPRTTEVGVQYARVQGDVEADDAAVTELRGVVSLYWQAHSLKLQADVGQVMFDPNVALLSSRARQGLPTLGTRLVSGEEISDTQLRVQLTFVF